MSKIRLWTLGSLEHNIRPTMGQLEAFKVQLREFNNLGLTDFIVGLEVKCAIIDGEEDILIMQDFCKSYLEQCGYTVCKN